MAATQEKEEIRIDVDLDNNMEWEVETESYPEYDIEPIPEELCENEYYDDPGIQVDKAYNKHIFTWLFSYLLGMFGVDRFCRGQVGFGILKIFTFGGFGFWYLADLIIAIIKSYVGGYRYMDDVMFDYRGRYIY